MLLLLLLSRFSCPTLSDPKDGNPPGSAVSGILQARTLEWVAISFSSAWKWKVKMKSLSRVWLLGTPWMQPTRFLHPWDFPGKNTGVGCQCPLRCHLLSMGKSEMKSDNTYSTFYMNNGTLSSKSLNQIFAFRKKKMEYTNLMLDMQYYLI